MIATLAQIALLFATLSLLAVGGGNGVLPAMQHAAVDLHHWMTDAQFRDLFAISRAAPGPGSLIVLLVGQSAAGLAGALVAGVAMYTPSCLVVYVCARLWRRFEAASWRRAAERALAPVAVGLTWASGLALLLSGGHEALGAPLSWAITGASALVLTLTEASPLPVMAAGAAVALAAAW